jgi:ABC-2 type transport system ATP-binding protein
MEPATGPVIVARDVVKRWGSTTALAGATLEVGRGVTGLLGANGAGKTTLLGLALGLERPDDGSLEVLGLDPSAFGPEVRARVGYVPEAAALPDDVRALDIVCHLAEVHGLPNRAAMSRASDALWQVGLGEERLRPVGTLSTGQRQRVKLAAALAHDPTLLLLDEPTNGLDPVQRDDVLQLVRRIGGEFGIDVVLSSHLLEEVERVADQVVILAEGRVVGGGALGAMGHEGAEVVVELDRDAAPVVAALAGRGVAAVAAGRGFVVPAGDDAALDAVRDVVAELGAGLRRLGRRRDSLEDVFLGADGSGLGERVAAGPAGRVP